MDVLADAQPQWLPVEAVLQHGTVTLLKILLGSDGDGEQVSYAPSPPPASFTRMKFRHTNGSLARPRKPWKSTPSSRCPAVR